MGDRFIANRSAMDFGYGISMLTEKQRRTKRVNRNNNDPCLCPASEEASYYRNKLAQAMNIRTRILEFNNNRNNNKNPQTLTPTPVDYDDDDGFLLGFDTPKHHRLRHITQTPEKTFDAPELLDSEDLNLLDWGSNDVVSIALGWSVYLWNASDETTSELVTVDEETGPVTSVKWAPDGKHIAVGLYNSDVQLWDAKANTLVSILRGNHVSGVGALDWKNHILTTGGWDGQIINNDSRVSQHIIGTYRGHRQHICGLKWSTWGEQLASGGTDHHLYIWDSRRMTSSSNARTQWLHKLEDHTGAVRALAWCPFRDNLLASGGGEADRSIKFWKTNTGACLNSVNTGSQVCALLWSRKERELLSSHGSTQNQLTLWKYPSMVKMAELTGHTSTVLFMAQSPDGCTVASAAGGEDEKLLFWNVFGTPEVGKRALNSCPEPFARFNCIR